MTAFAKPGAAICRTSFTTHNRYTDSLSSRGRRAFFRGMNMKMPQYTMPCTAGSSARADTLARYLTYLLQTWREKSPQEQRKQAMNQATNQTGKQGIDQREQRQEQEQEKKKHDNKNNNNIVSKTRPSLRRRTNPNPGHKKIIRARTRKRKRVKRTRRTRRTTTTAQQGQRGGDQSRYIPLSLTNLRSRLKQARPMATTTTTTTTTKHNPSNSRKRQPLRLVEKMRHQYPPHSPQDRAPLLDGQGRQRSLVAPAEFNAIHRVRHLGRISKGGGREAGRERMHVDC